MKIDGSQPIAEIAAELPGAIPLFESLGIDYACAGDRSLEDAAHAGGVAPDVVIASLRRLKSGPHVQSWNDRSLADLVQHLIARHHDFVRDEMAALALHLAELCAAPVQAPPELASLREGFTRLSDVVLPHLRHEESDVFPAIVALESAWQTNEPAPVPAGLSAGMERLAAEHGAISAQLLTMRDLRLRLEQENDLPARCTAVLDAVATLEAHLHEYMFLENCILFPRAAALAQPAGAAVT